MKSPNSDVEILLTKSPQITGRHKARTFDRSGGKEMFGRMAQQGIEDQKESLLVSVHIPV